MNDDRAADALALAEAALAEAMRDGVTEAEALVMAEDSALTRFANNAIHQNVVEAGAHLRVRVGVGRRVAAVWTNRLDGDGVADAARRASELARVVPENPRWAGLPAAGPAPAAGGFVETTATATPERRARAAGILQERLFKEGSDVKAGQPLYRIDAAPYTAATQSAQAGLARAEANAAQAKALAERYKPLVEANAVSKQEYANAVAAQKAAERQRKAEAAEAARQDRARQRTIDTAIRTGGKVLTSRTTQNVLRGIFGTIFGGGRSR